MDKLTNSYNKQLIEANKGIYELNKEMAKQGLVALGRKDEEIKNITVKYNSLVDRLRNTTKRPEGYSNGGSGAADNSTTCGGTQLFREDKLFLISEAQRADRILAERDYYFQLYSDAEKQLKEYYDNRQK